MTSPAHLRARARGPRRATARRRARRAPASRGTAPTRATSSRRRSRRRVVVAHAPRDMAGTYYGPDRLVGLDDAREALQVSKSGRSFGADRPDAMVATPASAPAVGSERVRRATSGRVEDERERRVRHRVDGVAVDHAARQRLRRRRRAPRAWRACGSMARSKRYRIQGKQAVEQVPRMPGGDPNGPAAVDRRDDGEDRRSASAAREARSEPPAPVAATMAETMTRRGSRSRAAGAAARAGTAERRRGRPRGISTPGGRRRCTDPRTGAGGSA